jgi:predicted transcriptional regulator
MALGGRLSEPNAHRANRKCRMLGDTETTLIDLTGTLVAAYVRKNAVPAASLPNLIATVHDALSSLAEPPPSTQPVPTPAVPVKKSIFPDYLVCLEDGKRFRTLRRHLQSVYGLTPEAYREKWGLKPDYPMVAPGYATERAALARSIGLGRRRAASGAETSVGSGGAADHGRKEQRSTRAG